MAAACCLFGFWHRYYWAVQMVATTRCSATCWLVRMACCSCSKGGLTITVNPRHNRHYMRANLHPPSGYCDGSVHVW